MVAASAKQYRVSRKHTGNIWGRGWAVTEGWPIYGVSQASCLGPEVAKKKLHLIIFKINYSPFMNS